ncbi:hypothetical protein FB451DRAFT_1442733 [Mycena latifolia]|nr:hypothetical protein FB451DRAFT_1442733 [Mycena latifolia]
MPLHRLQAPHVPANYLSVLVIAPRVFLVWSGPDDPPPAAPLLLCRLPIRRCAARGKHTTRTTIIFPLFHPASARAPYVALPSTPQAHVHAAPLRCHTTQNPPLRTPRAHLRCRRSRRGTTPSMTFPRAAPERMHALRRAALSPPPHHLARQSATGHGVTSTDALRA